MVTQWQITRLMLIRRAYGDILVAAASLYKHRPEVLAGIAMRESEGNAAVIGDNGHGHGLFQIDNRSFPAFCASDDWKDPGKNTDKGASDLAAQRDQVIAECKKFNVTVTPEQLERMAVVGYNAGANSAVHYFRHGEDIDTGTTGQDYSKSVLTFADAYAQLT